MNDQKSKKEKVKTNIEEKGKKECDSTKALEILIRWKRGEKP